MASAERGQRVEAHPVVLHFNGDMAGYDGQRHRHFCGGSVFANVRQRFLHEPVNRKLGVL